MLSRRPRSIPFTLTTSSSPPSFPGLVSCLRPIKRLILQLSDESSLLHRFSYKNKNQHKASKWWNKLISVDRIMFRLDEELNNLLQGFGRLVLSLLPLSRNVSHWWSHRVDSKDSEEQTSITREQVVTGLLQLPRSILLVEKVSLFSSLPTLLSFLSLTPFSLSNRVFKSFSIAHRSSLPLFPSPSIATLANSNRIFPQKDSRTIDWNPSVPRIQFDRRLSHCSITYSLRRTEGGTRQVEQSVIEFNRF